jgi:hypothetical protein
MTTNRKPRAARGTSANRTQAQRQKLIDFDSTGQLMQALWNYAQGLPVAIFDTTGSLLHGQETLKAITDTGASLETLVLLGIDRAGFEATGWPEELEAARRLFMEGTEPEASYLEWVRHNAALKGVTL